MVVGWKGRWKYKQCNAAKPKKHHIKTFGLCDFATGYVYYLVTYFGKETSFLPHDVTAGQAEEFFHTLLKNIDAEHHVFADKYYTTRNLVDYMLGRILHFTWTLNINRKHFAPELEHDAGRFWLLLGEIKRQKNLQLVCLLKVLLNM